VDTGARPARVARGSRTGPAESPASVRAAGLPPRLPGTSRPVQARAGPIEPERPPVAAVAVQTSAPGAVLLLQVAVTVLSIVPTVTAPAPVLPATGARPAGRCPEPAEATEAEVPGQAALAVEVAVPGRAVAAENSVAAVAAVAAVVMAVAAVVAGNRPEKQQMSFSTYPRWRNNHDGHDIP